jgi:predicted protein tyrosine phosphatase
MIKVLARFLFWGILKKQGITDSNVENQDNTFYISINSTEGNDNQPYFEKQHANVLTLYFDDCNEYKKHPIIGSSGGFYEQIPMSEEQALEVIKFVEKMDNNSNVYVHCTAGVSRSGAVGAFINDYFGRSWDKFKFDNPQVIPNSHISSLLKKMYYRKYENM